MQRKRALVLMLWLSVGGTSVAQDVSFEALIEQGLQLRQIDRNQEALGVFVRALALQPDSGQAQGQIALAQLELGHDAAAATGLRAALEHENDEWVERHRSALERVLEETESQLGVLVVDFEGATVRLEGQGLNMYRTSPVRIPIGPGQHHIVIEMDGRRHEERRVVQRRETILIPQSVMDDAVEAAPSAPPADPFVPAASPAAVDPSIALAPTPEVELEEDRFRHRRNVLLGVAGAAATAAGGLLTGWAFSDVDMPVLTTPLNTGLFISGVCTAVLSVILFFTSIRPHRKWRSMLFGEDPLALRF